MDANEYWRFVALSQRLDLAIQKAQAMKVALYQEYGLDPAKTYILNDEALTIEERDGG